MKAIIFAGIGLFAAATIYGIADFAVDKKKGTIDKLYKEETPPDITEEKENVVTPVVVTEEKSQPVNTSATVKTNTVKKKVKKIKVEEIRELKFSEFSRGRIPVKMVKKEQLVEPIVTEEKKEE